MKKVICFTIVLILISCTCAYAHGGRTDASGGHYNRSTGEYHYHHGYSAHQHPNGVCPYESSQSNTSSNSVSQLVPTPEPTLISTPTPEPTLTPKPTATAIAKTMKPTVPPNNIKNNGVHNKSSISRFFMGGFILGIIYLLYRLIKKTK